MSSKWFSVEDKLPDEDVYVLIVTKSPKGVRNIDKGYISDEQWVKRGGNAVVTHWMPMPDFPEED